MPRPSSKKQLLEQAQDRFLTLQGECKKLTSEEKVQASVIGDWSVKDILAHLMAWQQMALSWYKTGKDGETPITPSEEYTWRQIPDLNQSIYETYRNWSLDKVEEDLINSHQETLQLIEGMNDEELFTVKVYSWTKSTTLGSYLTSATSSHYEWARKGIRKGIKAKKADRENIEKLNSK